MTDRQQKPDDVASNWRVRFALPDGYFTFVDVRASHGAPMTKATVWRWGENEVRESNGKYLGVAAVYSIDHHED